MDRQVYDDKCLVLLGDASTYDLLQINPLKKLIRTTNAALKENLTEDLIKVVKNTNPSVYLYGIQKMH